MPAPMVFPINTPNRVILFDTVGDAVLSFEVAGNIGNGSIRFETSTDGVNFSAANFFSFLSLGLKPNVSTGTGFISEDRGSLDVMGIVKTKAISSPDFQGDVRLSVCEVPDAPTPPDNKCCPSPTVFFSLSAKDGVVDVWTPTPGSRFVLMGYAFGVAGGSAAPSTPLSLSLLDDVTAIGTDTWVGIPASPNVSPDEPLYNGPWIDLGDGYHSAAVGNILRLKLSGPLTSGLAFVTIAGREE